MPNRRTRNAWILVWILFVLQAGTAAAEEPGARVLALDPDFEPRIEDVRVEILDPLPKGDPGELRQVAETLIDLTPGQQLTARRLDAAVQALQRCREFESIHIDTLPQEDGVVLVFSLRPFRHIQEVAISGAFPLFQRDVRKAVTLEPGDVFDDAKLQAQARRIEALFETEGFLRPKAAVTAATDPESGHIRLSVVVDKGPYYRIGSLRIEGNRRLSAAALKLRMRTWIHRLLPGTAGRFRQRVLGEDVKGLVEHYRKKGFADVRIDPVTAFDDTAMTAHVTIRVEEGPLYRVRFEGNRSVSARRLRKEIAPLRSGNRNDAGIRKSVRNLEAFYRDQGFLQAEASAASETVSGAAAGPVREVVFTLEEGPQSVVQTVDIRGNVHLSEEAIRGQLLTRPPGWFHDGAFAPDTLDEDVRSVRALYVKNGFPAAEVSTAVDEAPAEARGREDAAPPERPVAVELTVDEGTRTRVGAVRFAGRPVLDEAELTGALRMKPGDPYREYRLRDEENRIGSVVSEEGHPHVTVESAVSFTPDRSRADIVYTVRPGPLVRMGSVVFSGNLRTDETVLRRLIRQRAGDPFSLKTLYEDQRRIRELDIVDRVELRTVGLEEKDTTVHAFFEVEERRPYYVQAGVGYETSQGVYGKVKAGDRNFMGANRELWLLGNSSEIGYRADAGIGAPYLLGTPIRADASLFVEREEAFNQAFGTESYGGILHFAHERSDTLHTGLGFRLERREQFFTSEATTGDTLEYEPRTLLAVTPTVRFDTRDSFIRPRKGMLSTLTVDVSSGLENDLDDFIKYHLDVRIYRGVTERLTLAFMSQFGYIDPYNGQDRVPNDQLFYLGGTSTVRGFDENLLLVDEDGDPVGGQWTLSGSVEARIALTDALELALFADTGRLGDVEAGLGTDAFRTSVGGGLRYQTPIGPMGLLYGYKLDRKTGESAGRVHFSVGYTF